MPQWLTILLRIGSSGFELTSKDAADLDLSIDIYDLRMVIPANHHVRQLVKTVETSVDPDSWLSAGGTSAMSVVGHVLIVAAPESTQYKIRSLLANLARYRDEMDVQTSLQELGGNGPRRSHDRGRHRKRKDEVIQKREALE